MEYLKQDMITAQENNFVYQIESENCARWVFNHMKAILGVGRVPNLFCMHLFDTEPLGFTAPIFSLIKSCPFSANTSIDNASFTLGASKKIWIIEKGKHICKS